MTHHRKGGAPRTVPGGHTVTVTVTRDIYNEIAGIARDWGVPIHVAASRLVAAGVTIRDAIDQAMA